MGRKPSDLWCLRPPPGWEMVDGLRSSASSTTHRGLEIIALNLLRDRLLRGRVGLSCDVIDTQFVLSTLTGNLVSRSCGLSTASLSPDPKHGWMTMRGCALERWKHLDDLGTNPKAA
jgi:hypothetical protein